MWLPVLLIILSCSAGSQGAPYLPDIPAGLIEPDFPLGQEISVGEVELGQQLFFDTRLSGSGNTSCATCHDPRHGFAEPRPTSISDNGQPQTRNAPSVINAGYLTTLMWDGRFKELEEQALDPFQIDGDMGVDVGGALALIQSDATYVSQFQTEFGSPPTTKLLARALSSYQRSLISGGTPFDRFMFEGEEDALSSLEKEGFDVFVVQGGCINCHDIFHPTVNPLGGGVALFTDFRFHNLGVGYEAGRMKDTGRFYATRSPEDWGTFKTPSLRNVELTAPYMHDGSLKTLTEVIEFYDKGGVQNPNISPSITPLRLSHSEKAALEAFLRTLTDRKFLGSAKEEKLVARQKLSNEHSLKSGSITSGLE